jgi:hypothetical protein
MFAVATGHHVAVNTILGLPFQKATGTIIDVVDNRVEFKRLDCPPFEVEFRRTSNHVPIMDEPSAQAQVQLSNNYSRVIKDIENLEQFYDARVLAVCSKPVSEKPSVTFETEPSIFDPANFKAKYSTGKIPCGPNGELAHPVGPDGRRLDGESESSDGSWYPEQNYRPDTPEPETEQQAKARLREMWVEPKR